MVEPQAAQPLPTDAKKVLIVFNDHHLGNVVIALPILEALCGYFDTAPDLLIDGRYLPLAQSLPSKPRLIAYPNRPQSPNAAARGIKHAALAAKLFARRYNAVIDLMGMIRSTRMTRCTRAHQRIGFGHLRNPQTYTHHIPRPSKPHCFDRYASFLKLTPGAEPAPVQLHASGLARISVDTLIQSRFSHPNRPLAVIHPSSGKRYRRWPVDRFAGVADHLVQNHNMNVAVIGTQPESDLMSHVIDQMAHADRAAVLQLSVEELVALFDRSAILFSNESGPTHLAAATPLPIVTIFGPSDENEWRPRRVEDLIILRGQTCDTACDAARCASDYPCLTKLSSQDAIDAVDRILAASPVQ